MCYYLMKMGCIRYKRWKAPQFKSDESLFSLLENSERASQNTFFKQIDLRQEIETVIQLEDLLDKNVKSYPKQNSNSPDRYIAAIIRAVAV